MSHMVLVGIYFLSPGYDPSQLTQGVKAKTSSISAIDKRLWNYTHITLRHKDKFVVKNCVFYFVSLSLFCLNNKQIPEIK